jgi:hypothetical protein
MLWPADCVMFYGRPDGTGPLLVGNPVGMRAIPSWGDGVPAKYSIEAWLTGKNPAGIW